MQHEIIMPALGMAQKTGLIVAWHKAPGDTVKASDILLDVETDKSTMEVEAGHDGYIAAIMAKAGVDVPVGDTIAIISTEKPEAATAEQPPASASVQAPAPPARETSASQPKPAPGRPVGGAALAAAVQHGRILASPKAKRLAAERGIELTRLVALGVEQPFHAADIEDLPPNEPSLPIAAIPSEIEARVEPAGLSGMLRLLSAEGGGAGKPALWAAFAASSLRASRDIQDDVSVQVEHGGKTLRYRNPDRAPLSRLEPGDADATVDVVVRDLTGSCLVSTRFTGEHAPVLTLTDDGGKASLRLVFDASRLTSAAGTEFVTGFAARMNDPLRQLL